MMDIIPADAVVVVVLKLSASYDNFDNDVFYFYFILSFLHFNKKNGIHFFGFFLPEWLSHVSGR